MSQTQHVAQPADSRDFNIVFPIIDAASKELEYRKARDLADFYSAKYRDSSTVSPLVVKEDTTLNCYYWKPQPRHPHSAEVWRSVVDIYEPVPLEFEADDVPVSKQQRCQGQFDYLDKLEDCYKKKGEDIRSRIKRQVGHAARHRGMGFEEVYIIAYGLFYKLTGVHPAVESARRKAATHLDMVFEVENGPDTLLECINLIILNKKD